MADRKIASANYIDGQFHNSNGVEALSLWDIAQRNYRSGGGYITGDWPAWVSTAVDKAPLPRVDTEEIRITFVNHATFLIQTGGLNILTDPVFSERVSPFSFFGPQRIHDAGIPLANLPPIDIVLISHDHYDHLDLNAVDQLVQRDQPVIYAGLGVSRHLSHNANVIELDWDHHVNIKGDLQLWFLEVQHNSGRGITDRNATLWGGYMLKFPHKTIYFGGDSGYADHYRKANRQFEAIDIAFLPIGAYAPRDIFKPVHLDPYEAVQAHLDLNAKLSIGMHFGTFPLTAEDYGEPLQFLAKAKEDKGITDDEFIVLDIGTPFIIPGED
jgi:L-ascorbate metabolism protein UlaG (beta-lactamase superfamily)